MTVVDLEVPQAAVEAVLNNRWGNEHPLAAHAEHQYDGGCAVCRPDQPGNIARVLTAAAPVLLAFHLRGIADEMRDVHSWLLARHVPADANPARVLATVRAALEATADRLKSPVEVCGD